MNIGVEWGHLISLHIFNSIWKSIIENLGFEYRWRICPETYLTNIVLKLEWKVLFHLQEKYFCLFQSLTAYYRTISQVIGTTKLKSSYGVPTHVIRERTIQKKTPENKKDFWSILRGYSNFLSYVMILQNFHFRLMCQTFPLGTINTSKILVAYTLRYQHLFSNS